MREILFRGQGRMGDWVYGWYVYGPKNTGSHFIVSYNAYGTIMWYEVDPATVGQFTGLTDMHGAKIFEGDIVAMADEYGKIEYSETEAMFQVVFDSWLTDFDHYFGTDFEVIGNIHDNPELLEQEA